VDEKWHLISIIEIRLLTNRRNKISRIS